MKLSNVLLLLVASHGLLGASDCESACPAAAANAGVYCINDSYYADSCRMACAGPDVFAIYNCGTSSQGECTVAGQWEKAKLVCLAGCTNTGSKDELYCGTSGSTYSNFCKFSCNYIKPTDVPPMKAFSCNSQSFLKTDCAARCSNLKINRDACVAVPDAPVCAIDGLIYRNTCEMSKVKYISRPADNVSALAQTNAAACADEAFRNYGLITGAAKPIRVIN